MEEIKKCPFCGGEAVLITNICESSDYTGYKIFHSSFGCSVNGMETHLEDTKEKAIRAWNKRVKN